MKLLLGFVLTFLIVSAYAENTDEENILKTLFENSKFTSIAGRLDDLEGSIAEFTAKIQQYAGRKDSSTLKRLQSQDMKTLIGDLEKIRTDFAGITANSSSVWEQVQSKIIQIQISEFEIMFHKINVMIIGLSYGYEMPNFHHSGTMSVARSFLEHHLVTVTIDAAKTERYINDSTKKAELSALLREIVQVSKDAHTELQQIFSDVNHSLRSFENPTVMSISQKTHALATIKIYQQIQQIAQDKLDKF